MSLYRSARLAIACVLFGASWTQAQPKQASQSNAAIQIVVRSASGPIARAQVIVRGSTSETDGDGRTTLHVQPGPLEITVVKEGYNPVTVSATAAMGPPQVIPILLERQAAIEEHVTVSATRTDKRIEDQPMRVEVLDAEEIEEKQLMTPGDIVMMLNEMGGLRVQATSPSLGAASVRVQGMRGRYTRFLSDGLPLFGTDVGGLGLLQIPPTDLGQVEVIKGVASALYGAGALGGVVDLISRRPAKEPAREALVNASKFAGPEPISLFLEVEGERLEVFIRDRGPGFAVEEVPNDRRGVRDSIVGRMERHGGRATVHSTPGVGTEVELVMEP